MKYTQTATYWAPGSNNGFGGLSFSAAASMIVRWEDKQEKYINAEGQEVLSQAIVYVQSDVVIKGYLYLGTSVASDPYGVSGAHEIKAFSKIPNLKGNKYVRKAWL